MAFGLSAGAAALIGAGVGAAGSIGGSIISGNAAKDAAAQQAAAAEQANQLQQQEFNQIQAEQAPYRQAGISALSQMQDPSFQHQFSLNDFQNNDPGYAFRMQQGQQALERSAAARGGLDSGAQLKAITQYGQDYASNEYQNAFNRFQTDQQARFGRLSQIAGMGQGAANMNAQAGMNYAANAGNNLTSAASASGAAGIAGANAMNSGIAGAGKAIMDYGASQGNNSWLSQYNPYMPVIPQASASIPTAPALSYAGPTGSPSLGVNYSF